jgi:predicted permease
MFREVQQKNRVFVGVAAFNSFGNLLHGTVGTSANLEPMAVELVSGTYFNVLGVNPVLGRVFTDADDQTLGGHPVAVISHKWWAGRFGRDPAIIGKTLTLGGNVYTIIGVAPPAFFGTNVGQSPDFWIPLQMNDQIIRGPHKISDKFYRSLDIMARLKPGISMPQARANVNLLLKQILYEYAGATPTQTQLSDIQKAHIQINPAANGISFLRDQVEKPLWMLMAMVGLVLIITCANIANLLLARSAARSREIAVRLALGCRRWRLIRQLLTESIVLAAFGGGLGILLASWATHFLLAMISQGPNIIPLDVSPDGRALAFTFLVSFAMAILFGILPAIRSTRIELTPSLKEGRGAVTSLSRNPLGKAMIVSQMALSLVLLVGSGLFLRSLVNLLNVNTGFDKQGVILFDLDPSATGYTDEPRLANLYRQVEERVDALPGVRASSFSIFNFGAGGWEDSGWAEGYPNAPERGANFNAVGSGYFATLGTPILRGRDFGQQDTASSPKVAVVNETMARQFFPGGPAIGQRFGMTSQDHSHDIEVIGVVRDAKYQSLDEHARPMVYFPYTQYAPDWGIGLYLKHFEVRFSDDPQSIVPRIRRTIADINASLPITNVQTLSERVSETVTGQRQVAQLATFFGLLALFQVCIGIYGLMSYGVSRRTNEIGIRMALGAQKGQVLRMVMREIFVLTAIGLMIGIPAALACGRLVASMLFGLKPTDPVATLAAIFILSAVATFAGYIPARRATKVDPMVALRYE